MRVLVLGVSGMLGHAVFKALLEKPGVTALGVVRGTAAQSHLPKAWHPHIQFGVDLGVAASQESQIASVLAQLTPTVVINCIGLVKQRGEASNAIAAITLNALLPQVLASQCILQQLALIHVSTDCVFSGSRGFYTEDDLPDAHDLYGRSKLLGEVVGPRILTLRTSIIGHELPARGKSPQGLLEWFLAQKGSCPGFSQAIFSGLPTPILATLLCDTVISSVLAGKLSGVYHVAAKPISKYNLLQMIAQIYHKTIEIDEDPSLVIDCSLDGRRFQEATQFIAPSWQEMIHTMYTQREINV